MKFPWNRPARYRAQPTAVVGGIHQTGGPRVVESEGELAFGVFRLSEPGSPVLNDEA